MSIANNSKAYSLLYPKKDRKFEAWSLNNHAGRGGWRYFEKRLHGSRYIYNSLDRQDQEIHNGRRSISLQTQSDTPPIYKDRVKQVLYERKRNKNKPLTKKVEPVPKGTKIKLKHINLQNLEQFKKEIILQQKNILEQPKIQSELSSPIQFQLPAQIITQSPLEQKIPPLEQKIPPLEQQTPQESEEQSEETIEINDTITIDEDAIKKIVRLAVEKGLLQKEDENNQLLLMNNIEFYLHQLNLCKCSICSCGKCMCQHPRARMQGLSEIKKDSSINNNIPIQLTINPELYENLSVPNRLRTTSFSFSSTYRKDFQSYSFESPKVMQPLEKQKLPFLGQSSYRNSYVNWKNYDESFTYKKPKFNHTGDCTIDAKSTYQQYFNSSDISHISQLTVKDVKEIQNQQQPVKQFIQLQSATLTHIYPQQLTSAYKEQYLKTKWDFHNIQIKTEASLQPQFKMSQNLKTTQQDSYSFEKKHTCQAKNIGRLYHDPLQLAKVVLNMKKGEN